MRNLQVELDKQEGQKLSHNESRTVETIIATIVSDGSADMLLNGHYEISSLRSKCSMVRVNQYMAETFVGWNL